MRRHPVIAFFVLCFAVTWGLAAGVFLLGEPLVARFGELDLAQPFWKAYFHLAVYAPAISALTVIGVVHGRAGLRAYLPRLLRWRVGLRWYLIVLLGFPLVPFIARLVMIALGRPVPPYGFEIWYGWLPWALVQLLSDPGPVEELGWRGFALPMLQRRFSALGASVLLGLIWGIWHLPAFYISALSQSSLAFPAFLLGSVALSVLMAAVYNSTGGSIPLAFLFHWIVNCSIAHLVGPEGLVFEALACLAAAALVTLWCGARSLGQDRISEPLELPWEAVPDGVERSSVPQSRP